MSTLASFFFPQQPLLPPRQRPSTFFLSRPRLPAISSSESRSIKSVTASASSFDELHAKGKPRPKPAKNSVLSNLIQEIEPLDVSIIQKGVPADTIDAMKRTISGMLGLLPSDQFHVIVEAFWDPLSKLLVSSMMTGYTLRNAEYRLCLERNLDIHEEPFENRKTESSERDGHEMLLDSTTAMLKLSGRNDLLPKSEESEEEPYLEDVGLQGLGEITPEVQDYVLYLQSRLSSVKKELHNTKRKNSALQMQHFVGEEKNDLLDYLRSLHPEKVAELSEPTCPESKETIHSVVHGLLATLSSKMHSKTPQAENATTGNPEFGNDDSSELMENTSLHFQPLISVSRDYLARLLFWCMLLGHYLRGLEYRLELMRLLTLSGTESPAPNGDQSA